MDAALASEIMQALRVIVAQPTQRILASDTPNAGVCNYEGFMEDQTYDTPFKFLGAGHFSAAFQHIAYPEYCFKIGFRAEDSGAMYAAWCRDNKLPNTPEIIHMDRWPEAYMVCMPCYSSAYEPPACVKGWNSQDITGVLQEYLQEDCRCWADKDTYKALKTTSVYATCKSIQTFFKGVAQIDMHGGNWMWDKNGEIVITDPVSFTIKKTEPRLTFGKARIHNPLSKDAICRFDRVLFTRFLGSFKIPQLFAPVRFPSSKQGFITNGGKMHVQQLQHKEYPVVSGLWSKLLNRI